MATFGMWLVRSVWILVLGQDETATTGVPVKAPLGDQLRCAHPRGAEETYPLCTRPVW